MNAYFDPRHAVNPFASPTHQTLADVLAAVMASPLSAIQKRDQASSVRRFAKLCRQDLSDIPADITVLRERLQGLNPTAVDFKPRPISLKTWSNIRSNFLAALLTAGITVTRTRRWPRSPKWRQLLEDQSERYRHGISRFAGFCTVNGIDPEDVSPKVWETFGQALRCSFENAEDIERDTSSLWNRLAEANPEQTLVRLPQPSRRRPLTRIPLAELPAAFRQDVEEHLAWAQLENPFVQDARDRPLAHGSARLRNQQILSAATALVQSGTSRDEITSLASLVTISGFRAIMNQRLQKHDGKPNAYEYSLAKALVAIADEWSRPGDSIVKELKRLLKKIKNVPSGLTRKNRELLKRLEDPATLAALINLPAQLVAEAEREPLSERSLAKAQAGIAICIGLFVGLRPANIASLAFDETLFLALRDDQESLIELPGDIVKNGDPFGTVLAPEGTALLRRYRDLILRPLLGRELTYLFDNGKGRPKRPVSLSWLVQRFTKRRLGFEISLHQFRHIDANILLDEHPGAYESASQFLGHKNRRITTDFYAGPNPARAARLHAETLRKVKATNGTLGNNEKSRSSKTPEPRRNPGGKHDD
jgi:integrase